MAIVSLGGLKTSLQDAKDRCNFFEWAKKSIWMLGVISLIVWPLLVLPLAYYLKQSALQDLASKVDGAMVANDPTTAKVAVLAKDLLVSKGYRCEPWDPLSLRKELSRRLQPILGDLLDDDFVDIHLPFWLNLAFTQIKSPNIEINNDKLKSLLQQKYISDDVLPLILDNQDKIKSIKNVIKEFQEKFFLGRYELFNVINFNGLSFEHLKAELQQISAEHFCETLTLSQSLVNAYLPVLWSLVYEKIDNPKFEIDKEGLVTFQSNQKISELDLEVIRSFADRIFSVSNFLKSTKINYFFSKTVLRHAIQSQFGSTDHPTAGHFLFINFAKQRVNEYLLAHPEFDGDRIKLFNYVAAISTFDDVEINIAIIKILMELSPDRLDSLIAIEDKMSDRFFRGFAALERMHRDDIKRAKQARRAELAQQRAIDITDSSSDEPLESSSGSRSPLVAQNADTTEDSDELPESSSGSHSPVDEWLRKRVEAQGSDVLRVEEA